jgi:low-affinity ferrous iron transport protein
LDRWLDAFVCWSGSGLVFTGLMLMPLVWAFLGIPYNATLLWQALISDVQAVISYLFDSLLMRQQLNGYEEHQMMSVEIQSRTSSHLRMVQQVKKKLGKDEVMRIYRSTNKDASSHFEKHLPPETIFEGIATFIARYVGHIVSIGIYWACIIIWLGFGNTDGWSPNWQLYINSATSAMMVFVFAFLANIRERHGEYARRCVNAIYGVDSTLELKL